MPIFRPLPAVVSFLLLSLVAGPPPALAQRAGPDWVLVNPRAPWQARDSQGEAAFAGRLWILGGWFDSYSPPPRDVWSSPDGRTWTLVNRQAPWRHSDLPMSLAFDDRLWMLGGWYGGRLAEHEATSAVWSSIDGARWTRATPAAGWSPRLAAAAAVFGGRMWILGGIEDYYFGDARSLKNDAWSSPDGVHWTCGTAAAPWAPRAYHQAVALGDKLYVLGGGNYVPGYAAHSDVWSTSDGQHWQQVTSAAPWSPRLWFSAVAYRDRLWVLGGWSNNPSRNWGDVWYSSDGRDWTQLTARTIWKERHEHSALVLGDKLFVAGGHAQPLSSEVWSLELPADFFQNESQ